MTHWFHLECAAFKRPEPILETLTAVGPAQSEGSEATLMQGDAVLDIPNRGQLQADARAGLEHRRLPRVDAASRAPSGRAMCRACKAAIEKGSWRIALVFYEDGRFAPSGFIHLGCAREYLETTDLLARLRRFSSGLADADFADIDAELARA